MHRRSRELLFVAILLLVSSSVCGAQTWAGGENGERPLLEAWPKVGLDVRILDKDDRPVKAFSVDHLILRDDGKEIANAVLSESHEPQSICLLQDTSGSTFADRKAIQAEFEEVLHDLPIDDEVCHISFKDKPILEVGLTTDRRRLPVVIGYNLPASGGSGFYDALKFALQELLQRARYRSRAIVLVGDGGDNISATTVGELKDFFSEQGSPAFFALVNRGDEGATGHGGGDRKQVQSLVDASGGMAYFPRDVQDAKISAQDLMIQMQSRYRLEFTAANQGKDGKGHTLDVKLEKDFARQDIRVLTPRGYHAPSQ